MVYPEIRKSSTKLQTRSAQIALKKIADSGGAAIFALVPSLSREFLWLRLLTNPVVGLSGEA